MLQWVMGPLDGSTIARRCTLLNRLALRGTFDAQNVIVELGFSPKHMAEHRGVYRTFRTLKADDTHAECKNDDLGCGERAPDDGSRFPAAI